MAKKSDAVFMPTLLSIRPLLEWFDLTARMIATAQDEWNFSTKAYSIKHTVGAVLVIGTDNSWSRGNLEDDSEI